MPAADTGSRVRALQGAREAAIKERCATQRTDREEELQIAPESKQIFPIPNSAQYIMAQPTIQCKKLRPRS